MNLFGDQVVVSFGPSELAEILKPIVGDGGHQRLLRRIVDDVKEDGRAEIGDADLRTAHRYANAYGGGGYQGRFRLVLAAARRAGWQYAE